MTVSSIAVTRRDDTSDVLTQLLWCSREQSRDREREKEKKRDREEDEEEAYERRKLERKLREKEAAYQEVGRTWALFFSCFVSKFQPRSSFEHHDLFCCWCAQQRLKNWELRERKKARDYAKESERDDERRRETVRKIHFCFCLVQHKTFNKP